MALFKKKETQQDAQPKRLFADSIDYRSYPVPLRERLACYVIGFAGGFALGEIFYGMLPLDLIAGIVCAFACVPLWRNFQRGRREKALKLQFRDMLESVSTSIGAGLNVMDSFLNAYNDMRLQYSEGAYITQELRNIVGGLNNNINIETMLNDFGERSGLESVQNFASVFETTYRKGGNIREVVKSTYEVINEKMEVETEIQTMVASANAELNMMLAMPVVIILLLRFMGGAFAGQGTALSIASTTVALVIFAGSYLVGRKIMTIRL